MTMHPRERADRDAPAPAFPVSTEPGSARKALDAARRIAGHIVAQGWVTGTNLGNQGEIMRAYALSRQTMREALRILQQQDVITTESGKGGGVIVKAPALDAVTNVIRSHIELAGMSFSEVFSVYDGLMRVMIDRAIDHMTPARATDLRQALTAVPGGRRSRNEQGAAAAAPLWVIARIAHSPCLTSLVAMLYRLVGDFAHEDMLPADFWTQAMDDTRAIIAELVARTCARDPAAHRSLDRLHSMVAANLAGLEQRNPRIWNRQSFLSGAYTSTIAGRPSEQKSAVRLAYRIAADVQRRHLEPGARLGIEVDLARRYDATPAIAAEAVRLLEFTGIVRVRRGRSAGTELIAPDATMAIDMASLYLRYYAPDMGQLREVRQTLERLAMRQAAATLSDRAIGAVLALCREATAGCDRAALSAAYEQLLGLAGNRVTLLIARVVIGASAPGETSGEATGPRWDAVSSALDQLDRALDQAGGEAVAPAMQALAHATGMIVGGDCVAGLA